MWSVHPCQKQPSMNTATFRLGNATSMVQRVRPGTGKATRNRSPAANSSRRTASSGAVSRTAWRLIRDETAGVVTKPAVALLRVFAAILFLTCQLASPRRDATDPDLSDWRARTRHGIFDRVAETLPNRGDAIAESASPPTGRPATAEEHGRTPVARQQMGNAVRRCPTSRRLRPRQSTVDLLVARPPDALPRVEREVGGDLGRASLDRVRTDPFPHRRCDH